jgi:hypothetical protein
MDANAKTEQNFERVFWAGILENPPSTVSSGLAPLQSGTLRAVS